MVKVIRNKLGLSSCSHRNELSDRLCNYFVSYNIPDHIEERDLDMISDQALLAYDLHCYAGRACLVKDSDLAEQFILKSRIVKPCE